jgi:ferredoxin--NADP+ reductase
VTVSLFDRLPTPFGLIRTGVAPDHPETKNITERFSKALQRRNVECFFNVEVGKDISLDELLQHHHAVIWAGGANSDRQLGISGEALPGCYSARDFVSWYNGHPGQADHAFELDPDRVVLIGNGNVALDVARILMLSEQVLGTTDMSDAAAQTISRAAVREVLVAARRGPEEAAYSLGELMALEKIEGVTLVVEPGEVGAGSDDDRRHEVIHRAAGRIEPYAEDRIIRLRYGVEPIRINGSDRVESITFRASDGHEDTIRTGTVFRAIGYRGVPVDGLPFDPTSGILPNDGGRVVSPESDLAVTGMYCAGWIKRGPRGVIGTNKPDAEETVDCILNDLVFDRLRSPIGTADTLSALLAQRGVELVDKAGWSRIDSTEKQLGLAEGRPRRKLVRSIELVQAARGVG